MTSKERILFGELCVLSFIFSSCLLIVPLFSLLRCSSLSRVRSKELFGLLPTALISFLYLMSKLRRRITDSWCLLFLLSHFLLPSAVSLRHHCPAQNISISACSVGIIRVRYRRYLSAIVDTTGVFCSCLLSWNAVLLLTEILIVPSFLSTPPSLSPASPKLLSWVFCLQRFSCTYAS